MSEKFITDEACERLIKVGLPPEVASVVQNKSGFSARMTMATGLLTLAILISLILASVFLQSAIPIPKLFVHLSLVPQDTTLIDVERIYPVCLVFVAISATGILSNGLALVSKDLATRSAITSLQKYVQRNSDASLRIFPGALLKRLDPNLHPADYLAAYPKAELVFAIKVTAIFVTLTFACFIWDGISASCATSDGVHLGDHFRLTRIIVPWSEIEELSTGCYCSGNGTIRNVRYVLHIADDQFADFGDGVSVEVAASQLDALDELDSALRKHRVPWRQATFPDGKYKGQVQWDPRCFRMIRDELSKEDWIRFRRIFRIARPR